MTGVAGFISMPGMTEWVVIALVGLLVFGRRLPDVARSLGQTIVSFKKGLREAEREVEGHGEPDRLAPGGGTGAVQAHVPPDDSEEDTKSLPPRG